MGRFTSLFGMFSEPKVALTILFRLNLQFVVEESE